MNSTISQDRLERMIERRRDFHRYPESGWCEFRTTARIAQIMDSLGYEVQLADAFLKPENVMGRNVDADKEKARALREGADKEWLNRITACTGLTAELKTGIEGPVVAMRFDIDCVDTQETDNAEHLPVKLGFRSENPGWMHACGHDGHMSLGLAVAEYVAEHKDSFRGTIRFLFQPAEEGVRGGHAMTQAGLLDDVDYFIALHLGLGVPTGTVYGGTHGFLCTTKIDAKFTGKGAHAGGEPNEGKNALLAAASAALNLHAIAHHHDGPSRINVGVLQAGEGRNVVPPNALMKIETRGATEKILNYVYERAVQVLNGAAMMYDCSVEIFKQGEANTTHSDEELTKIVCDAARQVEGVTEALPDHLMAGSDDACWMMKRVQDHGGKSTYIGLGAATSAGHHNSHFDFDEKCLPIGYGVLCGTLERLCGKE